MKQQDIVLKEFFWPWKKPGCDLGWTLNGKRISRADRDRLWLRLYDNCRYVRSETGDAIYGNGTLAKTSYYVGDLFSMLKSAGINPSRWS